MFLAGIEPALSLGLSNGFTLGYNSSKQNKADAIMGILSKIGYVISRQSALFSLPVLNKLRNKVYAAHLKTCDINVDDFVRIGPAHATPDMALSVMPGLRISRNCEVDSSGGIKIGLRVTISEDAKIYTHDHIIDDGPVDWRKNPIKTSPLEICDDAWIGAGAIILSSVTRLGRGCVVASGSVVRKNVPDFTIVAGTPAKIIRERRINDADK